MDVKPQKPVKFFTYKVGYKLADGNYQEEIITAGAKETAVFNALALLKTALTPTGSVSQIVIDIGNKKDTA